MSLGEQELDMPFLIDAWLERREPRVRVLDRKTGMTLRQWNARDIERWCTGGEICIEDLIRAGHEELKELVSELFLCACIEDIQSVQESFARCDHACDHCERKVLSFYVNTNRRDLPLS